MLPVHHFFRSLFLFSVFILAFSFSFPSFAVEPGDLDTGFDTRGWVMTVIDDKYVSVDVAVDSQGRIILLGSNILDRQFWLPFVENKIVIIRYNMDGSLDASFGGGTGIYYDFIPDSEFTLPASLLVDEDDNLIVVGISKPGNWDVTLIKILEPGTGRDLSFGGGNGVVLTDISSVVGDAGSPREKVYGATLDNSGRILVVGQRYPEYFIARYTAQGVLDPFFGNNGAVVINVGTETGGTPTSDYAKDVITDASGNIYVVGNSDGDLFVAKHSDTGNLVADFGSVYGIVKTDVATAVGGPSHADDFDYPYSLALDADGNILVSAASFFEPGSNHFVLLRYTPAGVLDASFAGGNGVFISPISQVAYYAQSEVVVTPSGNIVVGGSFLEKPRDLNLMRFTSTGNPDSAFGGGNGQVSTDLGNNASEVGAGLALTPSGKAVIGGYETAGKLIVAQYLLSVCGNNILEADEKCDDGNTNIGDGCSSTCRLEDDSDGDGIFDPNDNCPLVPNSDQTDTDDDGTGDACDDDDDDDGILDGDDNCPLTSNPDQDDLDGDNIGDVCDDDDDGDGFSDTEDNCPLDSNSDQNDLDGDGIGDVCDDDKDGDGILDDDDNCPLIANSDQADTDVDGIGNVCDANTDSDGDGIDDGTDNCVSIVNADQADRDGDRLGDACDNDNDNDGVFDADDNCPETANAEQSNIDGDEKGDVCDDDDDGDGISDSDDNCPAVYNPDQADNDGDAIGDACDDDLDGDGILNVFDNCPEDANTDQADADGDSIGDVCDPELNVDETSLPEEIAEGGETKDEAAPELGGSRVTGAGCGCDLTTSSTSGMMSYWLLMLFPVFIWFGIRQGLRVKDRSRFERKR